jgi:putative membrane protein
VVGFAAGLGLLMAGAATVRAQQVLNGPDQKIVMRLHELNQSEITMSKMAQERGHLAAVKDYADGLIRDHHAADQKLLAYAERQNMNMAAIGRPGDAMAHGTLAMTDLTQATKVEFDFNFARKMVADHQAAIDIADTAQRLARDPELRGLIGDMLPTLREHLGGAEGLLASIPEPPRRTVQLPGEPAGISRTRTGADVLPGVTAPMPTPR